MRTAYYNGISFESLGLIIRKAIIPPNSAEKRRTISIPDGPVIIENTKVRDPVSFPIECTVVEPDKLRDIYAMCQKEGTLILPDEPDKYYYGILTVSTPKNIILYYNNITFTMTAEPYAYSIANPEIICNLQTEGDHFKTVVTNSGTAECEPKYRIVADTAGLVEIWIDINGLTKSVKINADAGETIIIDVANLTVKTEIGNTYTNSAGKVIGDYTKMTIPNGSWTVRIRNAKQLKMTLNERWY